MIRFLIAIGLTTLLSQDSVAADLTLDQIMSLARDQAPDLRGVRETEDAGRFEAQTYLAQALPKLDFAYIYTNLDNAVSPFQNAGDLTRVEYETHGWELNFSSPLYTFGRVGALYNMYQLQKNSVSEQARLGESTVLLEIVEAYVGALTQLKLREVGAKALERARKLLKFAEVEMKGGAINQINFLKTQSNFQTAQAEHETREASYLTSLSELKIKLGLKAHDKINLNSKLSKGQSFFKIPLKDVRESSKLRVTRLQKEFAQENKDYRGAEYYPSISLFAQASGQIYKDDAGLLGSEEPSDAFKEDKRNYIYGVRFDWNIFSGTGHYANHRIAIAQAQLQSIEYDKELQRETVAKYQSKVELEAANKVFSAMEKAEKASQLALTRASHEFRNGAISLTELLEMEEELFQVEQQLIGAYGNLILATANYKINQGWGI